MHLHIFNRICLSDLPDVHPPPHGRYAASGPSFWTKEGLYWEQPLVQYEYK